MQPTSPTPPPSGPLSPPCELSLTELIRLRTGIAIQPHQREKLREALALACERFGHSSCEALIQRLAAHPDGCPEQEFLIGEITVGESYFFRDPVQIAFLRETLLPRLIASKQARGERSLRIWSAGCAGGQELYTIAILLRELLPDFDAWQLHLLGTDINTRVLAQAVRGRYRSWSFRATTQATLARHFVPEGPYWGVTQSLKERVKFCYLNLRDDRFPSILTETNALDLILCRNVFIYFDPETVQRVMEKFAACLVPGAVVMVASTDPLVPVAGLRMNQAGDIFFLEREGEPLPHSAPPRPTPPAVWAPPPLPPSPPPAAPPVSPPLPSPEWAQLLRERRWPEVLAVVEQRLAREGRTTALLQLRARCLANVGLLTEAAACGREALDRDPLDRIGQFTYALVLIELDRPREAEAALRRALYLDPGFAEAHYQLGLLALRGGDAVGGRKRLRVALSLLEDQDPSSEVVHAEGMTRSRLADILRSELSIYDE